MFLDRLRRQIRPRQIFEEPTEERDQLLPRWQILVQAHPRSRPTVPIPAVVLQPRVDWGDAFTWGVRLFPIFHLMLRRISILTVVFSLPRDTIKGPNAASSSFPSGASGPPAFHHAARRLPRCRAVVVDPVPGATANAPSPTRIG